MDNISILAGKRAVQRLSGFCSPASDEALGRLGQRWLERKRMATQTCMYKCQLCKQVIEPHTKAIRIPVETRTRQYPSRRKEVSRGRGKTKTITVPGGVGYEIVRELVACPDCAAKFRARRKKEEASV